jgi:hypothetical protein
VTARQHEKQKPQFAAARPLAFPTGKTNRPSLAEQVARRRNAVGKICLAICAILWGRMRAAYQINELALGVLPVFCVPAKRGAVHQLQDCFFRISC